MIVGHTFRKGHAYDRGHRIIDVHCFCGKTLTAFVAYRDHLSMKHPKVLKKMKKSGEWEQIEKDWPERPHCAGLPGRIRMPNLSKLVGARHESHRRVMYLGDTSTADSVFSAGNGTVRGTC